MNTGIWKRDDESSRIEAGWLTFIAELQVAPPLWRARVEVKGQHVETIGERYESREAAEDALDAHARLLCQDITDAFGWDSDRWKT